MPAIEDRLQDLLNTIAFPETPEERDSAEDELLATVGMLLAVVERQWKALDELMYVANHKAADNTLGKWWAEVIRGPIIRHLGVAEASALGQIR